MRFTATCVAATSSTCLLQRVLQHGERGRERVLLGLVTTRKEYLTSKEYYSMVNAVESDY